MMKRVVLVTGHYLESKRKAGFHWLADAYWRAGWEVIFLTTAISWLSWLQRNYRMAYPILREANHLSFPLGALRDFRKIREPGWWMTSERCPQTSSLTLGVVGAAF